MIRLGLPDIATVFIRFITWFIRPPPAWTPRLLDAAGSSAATMPKRARSTDDDAVGTVTEGATEHGKRLKQELLLDVAVKMSRKPPKKGSSASEEEWAGRLRLDGLRLFFECTALDAVHIEIMRDRVVDCKAAKNTALVKVIVEGEKRPFIFDMGTMEAAATMKESLRARSAEELAAEAEAQAKRDAKARRVRERAAVEQRQKDERKAFLRAHEDVNDRFDELVVKTNRLTEEDFWSDDSVFHAQLHWSLSVLEPEEEPALADEDNIVRITYERAMLPRLLACQPALKEAHRKLVLEGKLNERVFWQQYVCVRHALDPADLPGVSRSANSEDERRRKEADLERAMAVIREAVRVDSHMRLEEEELELTSDARDGMELLVRGATRASSGARYRKGYGLLGENAEAFFSGQATQSSGRQHAPDILRQLNMAGDHVVMQQLLGQPSLRHLPPSLGADDEDVVQEPHDGVKRFVQRARLSTSQLQREQSLSNTQYCSLEIFDAEFCYARRSRPVPSAPKLTGSPRIVSAKPSAEAKALTLKLAGGGGWRPDPKRRVTDTSRVGTPRGTVFDSPVRTNTSAWSSVPPGAGGGDDSTGATTDQAFKAELCKYAQAADTLLSQFWLAIRDRDAAKVQRLGAYGEDGNGSLDRLHDELQAKYANNATVRKSLLAWLEHAFEAFDKFKQDEFFQE